MNFQKPSVRRSILIQALCISGSLALSLGACSSAKKKGNLELSSLHGKKVALVGVDGEETSQRVVEVALINQLVQNGTFILLSKQDVEQAKLVPEQDPTDWRGIARRAGGEVALRAKVLNFDAEERQGYSTEEVYDSQLAEEMGTNGKTERVYKVKSLDGYVQVHLDFTLLDNNEDHSGIAEAKDRVVASAKDSSIHLPPKLRFLENIANKAFKEFFEKYQ